MSEPTPITAWFISRVVSRNRYAGALNGTVEGRGHIITTPIVSIKGRTVTTRSGSVYRLVGPDLWGRTNSHRSRRYPFYLDTLGADVWPVGGQPSPNSEPTMSEPTPIERAEALIRANPRERAAYEFGRADGWDAGRMTNQSARACEYAAAAYLLLADVEPDPLSYAALEQLAADTAARLARLRAALTVLGASSVHTFPAADAEAQEAARALVGGVR